MLIILAKTLIKHTNQYLSNSLLNSARSEKHNTFQLNFDRFFVHILVIKLRIDTIRLNNTADICVKQLSFAS